MIYLLNGQPGSGKTNIAKELTKLVANPIHIEENKLRDILDNHDYTHEGKIEFIKNIITIAKYLDNEQFNVIISVVCPYRYLRESFKKNNNVKEIYVHNDNLSFRKKKNFCDNYEIPVDNYIDINNTNLSIDESINIILKFLS